MKQVKDVFSDLIAEMLKKQGYSEHVQNGCYSDLAMDYSLPELSRLFNAAEAVWSYMQDAETRVEAKLPVLDSSNFVHTPRKVEEIQEFISFMPKESRGQAHIAVQITINYINSKE